LHYVNYSKILTAVTEQQKEWNMINAFSILVKKLKLLGGNINNEVGRNLNRMEINSLKIGITNNNNIQAIAREFNKHFVNIADKIKM
jgi:hypothetical protein